MSTETPLTIVHLSSAHFANDARILYKECKSLAKAGHDVTLIARSDKDSVIAGVKVKALLHSSGRLERWTAGIWRIWLESTRQNADVYHFHDPELIPIGVCLTLLGKHVIYDAHEDWPNTFPYKDYIPAPARTALGWFAGVMERAAVRCFAGVVAATPTIARRLERHNSNTVSVRNFPVLEEFNFEPGQAWERRAPLTVYVGSMFRERGFREAIAAISLLPKNLNAQLAFAGPVTPELRQEIMAIEGAEHVTLLGLLGRTGIADLLGRARIGLALLHPTPNFVNALPVKVFEYMSAGVPVVASDFPILREIIGDNRCGLLADPLDSKDIARAIHYLLTHPEEAQEMGMRGREAVKTHYNWSTEERCLLALYESVPRWPLRFNPSATLQS